MFAETHPHNTAVYDYSYQDDEMYILENSYSDKRSQECDDSDNSSLNFVVEELKDDEYVEL